MLGILLLYWIGKYYYQLAEKHGKSRWGFAIFGIVIYYIGVFTFGFFVGVLIEIISPGYWDNLNEMVLGLLMLPFGILSTFIAYKYLERTWDKRALDIYIDPIDLQEKKEPFQ